MADASNQATATGTTDTVCNQCDRVIPSSNIDLHFVHCYRNMEKCEVWGDMIPRKYAEKHFPSTHAHVPCSLCSKVVDRELLEVHKCENCPQRIVTCEYCEFPLHVVDLFEHQEVCGNRTESCPLCNQYVRLHGIRSHKVDAMEVLISWRNLPGQEGQFKEQGPPPRRQKNVFQRNRMLLLP